MKVGMLIDELISGGFQKVAIMEAKYFQKLGFEVFLVVLHRTKNKGYIDLIKQNNIKVIYLSDRLPFFLRINFHFPFFAFFSFFHIFYPLFIYKYIQDKEFDVFITHGTYTSFSSISIFNKLKIPYICFVHDSITYILNQKYKDKFLGRFLSILIPIANKLDIMIIKNAKSIIAFPDMITEMKKIFPTYNNYHKIFNGCETIEESKINFKKSNFAISVTKWDQGKNFIFLLDIWNDLEKKIALKIIGTFHPVSLKYEMEELIKQKGLKESIEIIGPVNESELSEYYKNAKFLIHPCKEAFGMTILEASANGCPAVFTDNSGVAVLYSDKIKKWLPEENNLYEYKNIINKFVQENQNEYENLVKEYFISAKNNSWIKHCKQIKKLINA